MIPEIIEPNPLLVEYLNNVERSMNKLNTSMDVFEKNNEWHYVQSDLNKNIFLLKRLSDLKLLPNDVNICDCGVGLATVLYDFYLQSKSISGHKFTFTGIEKYDIYLESFNENLKSYWGDDLNLIHDDVMNHDYSNYNFIWFYSPFRKSDMMMSFIEKIITEAPAGCLIFGLDTFRVFEYGSEELKDKFKNLKIYKFEDLYFYIK